MRRLPDPEIAERRASKAKALYHDLRQLGDLDRGHKSNWSVCSLHRGLGSLTSSRDLPGARPELAAIAAAVGLIPPLRA